MTTLQLREQADSGPVELNIAERDALSRLLPRATITSVPGLANSYIVNPRNTVGVARIGELTVEIQPKLPIERVLFLVAYSLNPRYWQELLVGLKSAKTLHEAIAVPFAEFSEVATRRGVIHGYKEIDESISGVKGRIRFSDQLRKRGRLATPIEVTYDEFTPDIEENRLLLAATKRLLKLRRLDDSSQRSLRRILGRLTDVTSVRYPKSQVPHLRINRLNRRYQQSLRLAELILNDETIELSAETVNSSGLLFDMAYVFENFVHIALLESLGLSEQEFPRNASKKHLYLDSEKRIALKPDLSWWRGSQCLAVGDIKYKKTDSGLGKNPDLYQLLAYVTATALDEGFLIYAATEGQPNQHTVPFANKLLHINTLHLGAEPSAILNEVEHLAQMLRSSKYKRTSLLETNSH